MSDKDHHQAGGGAFKISRLAFPPLGAIRHNDAFRLIINPRSPRPDESSSSNMDYLV